MPARGLRKARYGGINKDAVFAIMDQLTLNQRAVLSLRHFEKMNLEQICYILGTGRWNVIWHLLTSRMKLKISLVINGYHALSLKSFLVRFQSLTEAPYQR